MTAPRVIALCGLAGSGKSTIADHLIGCHGFTRVKFADTLKAMLRMLGLDNRHIEGELKELPCPMLGGATPRHAMITLGTEWGRDMIWRDLWVSNWLARAQAVLDAGGRVVVDDMRFPNEAEYAAKLGAVRLRVVRPGATAGAHVSEAHAGALPVDFTVANDSDVPALLAQADRALNLAAAHAWPD